MQYFLKWKGFAHSENTWEPVENLGCPELIAAFEENRQKEIREKEQDDDKDKKKVKDKEKDADTESGKEAAVSIHFYLLNRRALKNCISYNTFC